MLFCHLGCNRDHRCGDLIWGQNVVEGTSTALSAVPVPPATPAAVNTARTSRTAATNASFSLIFLPRRGSREGAGPFIGGAEGSFQQGWIHTCFSSLPVWTCRA